MQGKKLKKMYKLTFPDQLTINHIKKSKTKLIEAINSRMLIRCELDPLNHIDTAGIQLILGFFEYARKNKITVEIEGDIKLLKDKFEVLGIKNYLAKSEE